MVDSKKHSKEGPGFREEVIISFCEISEQFADKVPFVLGF